MVIGEALKRARERAGLTQKQLADMLYVDTSLICRWEKGQRKVSLQQLSVILDVLGLTKADIDKL